MYIPPPTPDARAVHIFCITNQLAIYGPVPGPAMEFTLLKVLIRVNVAVLMHINVPAVRLFVFKITFAKQSTVSGPVRDHSIACAQLIVGTLGHNTIIPPNGTSVEQAINIMANLYPSPCGPVAPNVTYSVAEPLIKTAILTQVAIIIPNIILAVELICNIIDALDKPAFFVPFLIKTMLFAPHIMARLQLDTALAPRSAQPVLKSALVIDALAHSAAWPPRICEALKPPGVVCAAKDQMTVLVQLLIEAVRLIVVPQHAILPADWPEPLTQFYLREFRGDGRTMLVEARYHKKAHGRDRKSVV